MALDHSDPTLPEADRKQLIRWATACVRRLLPIFQAAAPDDDRLVLALDGADEFAHAVLGVGAVRKLAFGCHAAAREVNDPAATAIARACGQAVSVAHMAGHSREIARYTAKALGSRAGSELVWQREALPKRYRDYVYGSQTGRSPASQ
jgi:hypothetical protein